MTLASWVDGSENPFPLRRAIQWQPNVKHAQQAHPTAMGSANDNDSGPAIEDAHQNDIEVDSLISAADWDAAKWKGAAFAIDTFQGGMPILALAFEGADAARRIFAHWQADLGNDDIEERVRIVVIKGISRANPHAYRIAVSGNPKRSSPLSKPKFYTMMSRMKTMEPTSSQNLSRFLALFQRCGKFGLTWANCDGGGAEVNFQSVIRKRELTIRNAWQIGVGDQDSVTIQEDDNPVIPVDETNPPISKLLAEIRRRNASS